METTELMAVTWDASRTWESNFIGNTRSSSCGSHNEAANCDKVSIRISHCHKPIQVQLGNASEREELQLSK